MHTIPVMHAMFAVDCWINMRPLNHTQTTNLQLYYNQSINHNSWFGVRGGLPKYFCPESPYLKIGPCLETWGLFSFVNEIYRPEQWKVSHDQRNLFYSQYLLFLGASLHKFNTLHSLHLQFRATCSRIVIIFHALKATHFR